ncbi:MAG: DUF6125 family protein [Ruminococcus flavefaciens]|nr:DUF6125 family protein [Ruminococcus flavefaciens]
MISDEILKEMSHDELTELIHIYSKNWLAIDGAWFQAVEKSRGMDEAMLRDAEAWKVFTVAEARRIKKFLKLPEQAELDGLEKALKIRFYANINTGEIIRENNTLTYKNTDCFVQTARQRKNMEYHSCKSVGIIEYSEFAKVIDNRISCECLSCYPDITDNSCCCSWKFTLEC